MVGIRMFSMYLSYPAYFYGFSARAFRGPEIAVVGLVWGKPRLNEHICVQHCVGRTFYCLAASLNLAFKWFSMFGLDQTFSPNILLY